MSEGGPWSPVSEDVSSRVQSFTTFPLTYWVHPSSSAYVESQKGVVPRPFLSPKERFRRGETFCEPPSYHALWESVCRFTGPLL